MSINENMVCIPRSEQERLLAIESRARLVFDSTNKKGLKSTIFWILKGCYPGRPAIRQPSIHLPQEVTNESND